MMVKKTEHELAGLVELALHGYTYVMPVDDAMQVFRSMQGATEIDSSYDSGTRTYYIGKRKTFNIAVKPLDHDAYIEATINGVKP